MKKSIWTIAVLMLTPFTLHAAELVASVDNPKVAYGETIELRLSYDGNDGASLQPDLSPLQQDFVIYSTSSSLQSSFINGQASQKREWIMTLLPQNTGMLTIPSISAGAYSSQPLNVEVVSSGNISAGENQLTADDNSASAMLPSFSADLVVKSPHPYIGQALPVELVIKDNRDLQFSQEPSFENSDNWIIKRAGQPQAEIKDGLREVRINYLMFPQQSGELALPRAVIEGYYITYENLPQRPRSRGVIAFFDMDINGLLGVQKPVLIKSQPQNVNISPIPADFPNAWWLPATAVTANAVWVDKKPHFKVGELVTREITITASGVSENQLPELEFPTDTAWKQYPEKPQYTSAMRGDTLISQEVIRVAYIPQQEGKQKLPEIRIPWFNVQTQQLETAVVDGEEIEVENNPLYQASPNISANADETMEKAKTEPRLSDTLHEKDNNGYSDKLLILYAAFAAFLSGLAVSFILFGRKHNTLKHSSKELAVDKNFKQALSAHDYRAARDALVQWGQQLFPSTRINNLHDLDMAVNEAEFSRQMTVLNALLYGGGSEIPNADIIISALKSVSRQQKTEHSIPLPNLYK